MNPTASDDFPCNVFVELVTEYLDGAMPAPDVARVDAHLTLCIGCRRVLEQFRVTIRIAGHLDEVMVAELDPGVRDRLVTAFRAVTGAPNAGS